MKVLLLVDTLEVGGAEKSLYELCRRYRRTEPVMCPIYQGDALRPVYEEAGIRVVGLDLEGRYSPVTATRTILELIRRERPDALHGTLFRAGLLARLAGRRTGLPVLDSLVNDSYSTSRWQRLGVRGAAKLTATWAVDRATVAWATRFVANSRTIKEAAVRQLGLDPAHVEVIHRGRDPRPFDPIPPGRIEEIRWGLGVPAGAPLLLHVGRLVQRKGQSELIRALATIHRREPEARLFFAGSGPDRPALESLAARKGVAERTIFLGHREDVPELLRACDLFLFPSHYEGLPGAMIEAMLAAAPIVASDTPVHRECLGSTGVLVPAAHPEALAAAAVRLLADPGRRRNLGAEARSRALELFDIQTAASLHEDLYREVVRSRSAA